MALYYDEQFTQAKCSNALDPNSEWFSFMHFKLLDWQQKIGSNQFSILTGQPQWEAARDRSTSPYSFTNTSNIELQLEFYGNNIRAGDFSTKGQDDPSYGFMFAGFSSDYFYFYDVNQYTNRYGLENTSDRGQMNYNFGQARTSINDFFRSYQFNNPKKSFVVYSDEPGDEWFAWNAMERDDYCAHGIIHKAKNINPEVPYTEDICWLLTSGQTVHNIGPSPWQDQIYNSSFKWQAYPQINYGTFGAERVTWMSPARIGQPVVSAYGFPICDSGDRVLFTSSDFALGYTYEINGSQYLAISSNTAVKTS